MEGSTWETRRGSQGQGAVQTHISHGCTAPMRGYRENPARETRRDNSRARREDWDGGRTANRKERKEGKLQTPYEK